MKKKFLITFLLICSLLTVNTNIMAATREEAIIIATEELRKANKPGKYRVYFEYVYNGKVIQDSLVVTVVDTKKSKPNNNRNNNQGVVIPREESEQPTQRSKKKDRKKKEVANKENDKLDNYQIDTPNIDLFGFEKWYLWVLNYLLLLLILLPAILLYREYKKSYAMMREVISLFIGE